MAFKERKMKSKAASPSLPVADGSTSSEWPPGPNEGSFSFERVSAERQYRVSSSSIKVVECDVLLGRGKSIHTHSGNIEYRKEIKARSRLYQKEEDQVRKQEIAVEVIQAVRDRGGRFLQPAARDIGNWEQCPMSVVRTKVKQALRDIVKEPRDAKRAQKASTSSTNRTRSLRLQQTDSSFSVSPAVAVTSPPPRPSSQRMLYDHIQVAPASSQLSGIDEIATSLAAAIRPPMMSPTSSSLGLHSRATTYRPSLSVALQQPTTILPLLTQLDRSRLTSASAWLHPRSSSIDVVVPNLQQYQLHPVDSDAPVRGTEQQLQLLGLLSRLEMVEIDELARRLRRGG